MRFLVEIEIRGPLEDELRLRASDTVEGCQTIEERVRNGFLPPWPERAFTEMFLTVRAMEHVTVPSKKMMTIDEFGPIRGGLASDSGV